MSFIDSDKIPELIITGGKTKSYNQTLNNLKTSKESVTYSNRFSNKAENSNKLNLIKKTKTINNRNRINSSRCKCNCQFNNRNNNLSNNKSQLIINNHQILQQNNIQSSSYISSHIDNLIRVNDEEFTNNNKEIVHSLINVFKPIFNDLYHLILAKNNLKERRSSQKRVKKKKLITEEEKSDLVLRLNQLNYLQLLDLKKYLPEESFKDGIINIKIDQLGISTFNKLYEYVKKCNEENLKNPYHKSFRDEVNIY
jgi:hypothetical protein